jgi:receptor protein-tyrosine kinase
MSSDQEKESANTNSFSYHTVFAAFRCWWKIVVPTSIVLGCGAAIALIYFHKPQYTADAWLMIREHQPVVLTAASFADSKKFIQNQIEIIRSPKLLGPLASKPEIVATPEFVRELDIAEALARRLSIKSKNNSDLYVVSFTSESPEKAEIIVREVVDAYLRHNEDLEMRQNETIVQLLKRQADDRYREMSALRADVRQMSIDLTGVDPFAKGRDGNDETRQQSWLANLQSQVAQAAVERDILTAKLKAKEAEVAPPEPSAAIIEAELNSQESYLYQVAKIQAMEKREKEFQNRGKNAAAVHAYKQLQADLVVERAALDKLKADLAADIKQAIITRQHAAAESEKLSLRAQQQDVEARLASLGGQIEKEIKARKEYTGETLDLEFKRAKLAQVSEMHEMIHARMLTVSTENDAPERVTLFKEATKPVHPDEMLPWKKIGMGAALAFLFPLGLCVAYEHFFRRVGSRSQIEHGLQELAVVGEVTAIPSRTHQARRNRQAAREVLLFEESVDSLRTHLSLMETSRECRVIAITSAVSGEGKTSLAAQLAVCIARATKQSTLLIDGDLRSPDIHNIFEIDSPVGLADVLQNNATLNEAIDETFSERLHILPAGRLKTNPHRLLGCNAFSTLIDELRTKYQYIVIDTPPVLPASESLVMASAADAAILCTRRDFSRVSQSQAAYARMQSAGVKVAGAVINGIPIRQYAYQYGNYAYLEDSSMSA